MVCFLKFMKKQLKLCTFAQLTYYLMALQSREEQPPAMSSIYFINELTLSA